MRHWTAGSFLLAFAGVVTVSGALGSVLRRVLQRSREPRDAATIFVEGVRPRLQGTAATLVGLGVALVLFPIASMLGLPIRIPGLSVSQSLLAVVVGVGLVVVVLSRRGSCQDGG